LVRVVEPIPDAVGRGVLHPAQYLGRRKFFVFSKSWENNVSYFVGTACDEYRNLILRAFYENDKLATSVRFASGTIRGGEDLMDPFSKKMLDELVQMQQHTGRILRSMSLSRMMPMDTGGWQPAVDIYEAEDSIFVYAELAGVIADSLQVTVDGQQLRVSGMRQLPDHASIACIHQLEIELGGFQRTVSLPSAVEVEGVESSYVNGILVVVLPKRVRRGKVTIRITPGE
jgi:HSP20 family protein